MDSPVRIAIVSPSPAVRAGLRALLGIGLLPSDSQSEITVTAEAATLADLELYGGAADILVIAQEAFFWAELSRFADAFEGQTSILLLTDNNLDWRELERLPLRAWGVLGIDCSGEELAAAVQALAQGLWVGEPRLMLTQTTRLGNTDSAQIDQGTVPLTERESEILQLLARGLANKQIAAALGISEHTVKFHASSIYTKLRATNRAEAVRRGIEQGWVVL